MYSWDSFICSKMNESYSKVAFRKLKCTRRPDAMRKLETFVRSNNGAQYQLNYSDILFPAEVKEERVEKTFFCSELVADCLKIMGVLSNEPASRSYWPSTFEKDSDQLSLLNSAYFEDIQEIDFN